METEKNPYILQSEVGNTMKEMRDKTVQEMMVCTWGCTRTVRRRWSQANDK